MTIDEFRQVELRTARILSAEPVPGSEKLLKLAVDAGEPRQIVSGIAKEYTPEDLIGKDVIIVANLESRQIMGLESRGMLLAAHGEDGEPVILMPGHPVAPGSKIS